MCFHGLSWLLEPLSSAMRGCWSRHERHVELTWTDPEPEAEPPWWTWRSIVRDKNMALILWATGNWFCLFTRITAVKCDWSFLSTHPVFTCSSPVIPIVTSHQTHTVILAALWMVPPLSPIISLMSLRSGARYGGLSATEVKHFLPAWVKFCGAIKQSHPVLLSTALKLDYFFHFSTGLLSPGAWYKRSGPKDHLRSHSGPHSNHSLLTNLNSAPESSMSVVIGVSCFPFRIPPGRWR